MSGIPGGWLERNVAIESQLVRQDTTLPSTCYIFIRYAVVKLLCLSFSITFETNGYRVFGLFSDCALARERL